MFGVWFGVFFPVYLFQRHPQEPTSSFHWSQTGLAERRQPAGSKRSSVQHLRWAPGRRPPSRQGHPTSLGTQCRVSAHASFPCHLFQRRHVTGPESRNTATKYRHCQGTSENCLCQKTGWIEISHPTSFPASAFPHLLSNRRKNYTLHIWRRILSNSTRQNLVFITLYQLLLHFNAVWKYWQISDLNISYINEQASTDITTTP